MIAASASSAGIAVLVAASAAAAATAASAQAALNFAALGDWGVTGFKSTAAKMADVCEKHGAEFFTVVGDNFYESGVSSVHDPQWNTTFEDVYTQKAFMKPWNVLLGNHDHRGNITAQIDYTHISDRWNMPAQWFVTRHELIPEEGDADATPVSLDVVHLDTVVMTGLWQHGRPQPDGALDQARADEQLEWLKKTLAASNATWIIVAGHYPVYSTGEHGPTPYMVENVRPLLIKYGVALYLDGHDHGLQHNTDGILHYIVAGAGAKSEAQDQHTLKPPARSLFAYPASSTAEAECMATHLEECFGFVHFSLTKDSLNARFYSTTTGHHVYEASIPNRRK